MKKALPILLAALMSLSQVTAQDSARQLFDGGMMMHTGFMSVNIPALEYQAEGLSSGMGGTLRFHIGKHLRVGGEGAISTMPQLDNGSYFRTSWGGVVADMRWTVGRWMPYAGMAAGGGKVSTLLVFDGDDGDWVSEPDAVLHNEKFLYINPYLGIEYALTRAMHLTARIDRIFPWENSHVPTGFRLYFGFIFAH